MNVLPTSIAGVLLIETSVHGDARGMFREVWQDARYASAGVPQRFVQDNASTSHRNVVRGLHYQYPDGQDKLVSVLSGTVLDVALDIRRGSPTFGQHVAYELSGENGRQLLVPGGCAHGFVTRTAAAVMHYRCSAPYNREAEGTVLWSDPALGIDWGVAEPALSPRDRDAPPLSAIPSHRLPPMSP